MKETLNEYLQKIAKSKNVIREHFDQAKQSNKCLTTLDLNHACSCLYGEEWEYDAEVDACLNRKLNSINKLIYKEGTKIKCDVGSIDTTTLDGSLRGTWGTPIQSDNQLFDGSDNAKTVMGTDPSQPMQSGYDYAKRTIKLKI